MPYTTTTLAALRADLQARYDAVPFWTDTDARDALNEAMRQFNLFTGYWRGTSTSVTGVGARFISVPAALTYRTRVFVSGRVITRKSLAEFYRMRRNWRTQTTTSGSPVPSTIQEWAPIGLGQIALWPADAAGGTSLSIDGIKLTPTLSADGDTLDLGTEEHAILLDEALYILAFKRPSLLEQMQPRHQAFLQGCLARNELLRGSAYFRRVLGLPSMEEQSRMRRKAESDSPLETLG